ncbi:MAG: DUF4388 domain-containing protein [Chitinispirillaceae bacterium]|nr:DUF4388 domain-containing protein [Chitinispirillaceae bacterium]
MTRSNCPNTAVFAAAFFGIILFLNLSLPVSAAPKEIEIKSFYAKVYVAPSTNANFIGLTQKGERYPILGIRDSWYHIRFKNVNGWIEHTQVRLIDPEAVAAAAADSAAASAAVESTEVAGTTASVDSPGIQRDTGMLRAGADTRTPAVQPSTTSSSTQRSSSRSSSSSRSTGQSSSQKSRSEASSRPPEKKESRLRSWFTQQNLPELPPTLYPESSDQQPAMRYFQIKFPARVLAYLSPDAPILGMTRRGQLLPLVSEGDSWCRVAFSDTVGWIEKKHGRIIDPEASVSIDYVKVGIIGGVLVVIIIVLIIVIIRLVRRPGSELKEAAAEKHAIILARTVKSVDYTLTNGTTTLERCFSEVGFTIVHIRDMLQLKDAIQQSRPEVVLIDYQFEKEVVASVERICARLDENDSILYLVYNVPDPSTMKPGSVLPKTAFLGSKFSDRELFKLVTPLIRGTDVGRIQKSVQSSALAGDIAEGNLLEVLQFIEIGSKTGCLLVEMEKPFAIICFKNGRIIFAATADKITGREAIFKVLELKTGKFRFVLDKKPRESNVNLSTLEVLMEWAKAIDEAHQH